MILVCFAARQEARFFSVPKDVPAAVDLLITGMGRDNAAGSIQKALRHARASLVLTCGFAGGLRPGLPAGAVVCSAHAPKLDLALLTGVGAIPVTFHCSPRVAVTVEEKEMLRRQTGADAVEMESEVIHQVCQAHQIRCLTVRVISDSAEENLPLDFNALMTERMQIDYARLAWALLRSPGLTPALLQLNRKTRLAARRLAALLEELLRRPSLLGGGSREGSLG